jgi:eukaryotic-like serine/threonine-protein kinase
MTLAAGTQFGHYEIQSRIGAGGMGEVFLAKDAKLDRQVAIKVLPVAATMQNADNSRRFEREARAASRLNHPNILTIHEIGEINDSRFIATEFIKGETLRERLNRQKLSFSEALDIAIQVAAALNAAHSAGIIHRDIKPENIMIRREDGLVKVLDFGLAKLTEKQPQAIDTEGETRAQVNTSPGMVMGTARYMSPEQARGKETDMRTDVWSLGVCLYEMLSGEQPFAGETTTDTLAAILHREPAPLDENTPPELARIIRKALQKNADERYQTVKDFLLDLKNLKRELEVAEEIERSAAPFRAKSESVGSNKSGETAMAIHPAAVSTRNDVSPQTSSAEYILGEIKQHKRGVLVALSILILAAVGLGFWYFSDRFSNTTQIESIAVLPFENAGGNEDAEYLSDGIAESLINSLTELRQLRVIARSTAFRYKNKEIDPQAAGRELNVRAVLTGRVRQMGERLSVQVDLVDVATGTQLWGKDYERQSRDALSVKQAIVREITTELGLKLSGDEKRQLARRDTTSAEAYQSYLRGRYYWNKRTAEGMKKAIEEFQQAIERDPNYALGYAGLADCYVLNLEDAPKDEAFSKAKAYAERALQIDDSLAEAHASLALIYQRKWQWDEAGKAYKRAIELNPNYPTARHWHSIYLRVMGRFDESLSEAKRAQELDPLSLVINTSAGFAYLAKGDANSAVEQGKKVLELDPKFHSGYDLLGVAYLKQRRYPEAVAVLEQAISDDKPEHFGILGYAYALAGKRAEALAALKKLEEEYAKQKGGGKPIALVYVGLGEGDKAFAWLEKAYQARSGGLPDIRWDPEWDSIRGDSRYRDLVQRMGLEP